MSRRWPVSWGPRAAGQHPKRPSRCLRRQVWGHHMLWSGSAFNSPQVRGVREGARGARSAVAALWPWGFACCALVVFCLSLRSGQPWNVATAGREGTEVEGGSSAHCQEAPNWVIPSNPLHIGECLWLNEARAFQMRRSSLQSPRRQDHPRQGPTPRALKTPILRLHPEPRAQTSVSPVLK